MAIRVRLMIHAAHTFYLYCIHLTNHNLDYFMIIPLLAETRTHTSATRHRGSRLIARFAIHMHTIFCHRSRVRSDHLYDLSGGSDD